MAEKILQTRIINKHAALENWKTSELPLKTGEIALAYVETTKPDGHGGSYTIPTYLMKVGHDNKKFSELEWLAAPASDVHAWAKAATKPSYVATEIARGTSTVAADLGKAEEAILALQSAVGSEGSVAEMITAAIEALDVTDAAVEKQFVTAVAETDGKISVTRRALTADDIPTLAIAKISGLQDALNAKLNSAKYAEDLEVINGAISDAQDAADAAQEHSEGVASDLADYETANDARVKAIEDDYTTAAQAGSIAQGKVDTFKTSVVDGIADRVSGLETTVGDANSGLVKALAEETARATGVEGGLNTRLTTAENAIATLNAATTLEGVGKLEDRPESGKVAGAIWIATDNNKEYVWDGAKWVELGDTTAELNEISSLKDRATALETSLAEGGDTAKAIAAAQSKAEQGVADAATAKSAADAAQAAADAAQGDATSALDKLAVVQGSGAGSIAKALADAESYTNGKIATVNEAIEGLTSTVETNKTAAAAATKEVADALAEYKTTNDTAVGAAQAQADKGVKDAADALTYAKGLETGVIAQHTEAIQGNASAIDSISKNFAKVKADNGKFTLVVGEAEDVIIFDCGNEIA